MYDPGSGLEALYIFIELSDRFSGHLDRRSLHVVECASVSLSLDIVERRLYRRVHIIVKRSIVQSRCIVEGRHVRVDFEHIRIDESLLFGFLFFLFLLCLENIDETHRTAAVSRRRHLGVELLFVDAACRCPRRLDIRDLSLVRLINDGAPVKGDALLSESRFSFRFFYSSGVELRLFECGVATESEFLPGWILHPGSAFAAELRAVCQSASAIATEQCYTSSFIERPDGQNYLFLHIKICLFTNIQ